MSEPTDILLSVLEKKWPEGIPLREFDDVIRVMMGLADLLAPSRPTKKARAAPAVHVVAERGVSGEWSATVQPKARVPNSKIKAAMRDLLSDGEGHSTEQLASALGRRPGSINRIARSVGATSARASMNGPEKRAPMGAPKRRQEAVRPTPPHELPEGVTPS